MANPKRQILWSPEAEADLIEIWNYLAREASLEIADKRVREINDACGPLGRFPLRGRPRDELVVGLRSIVTRPHIVFYRVTSNDIEIARVLHGRQDIESIFGDDV